MDNRIYHDNYAFEMKHWWFIGSRSVILSQLETVLKGKKNPKILDAGCGTGGTLEQAAELGEAYGFDSHDLAIEFCHKRNLKNVKQGTLEKIPFEDNQFDAILANDVLEHTKDDLVVIKELHRVTKDDGCLVITVPAYEWLWTDHDVKHHHFRRYTRKMLKERLEQSGFKVEKISHYNTFLFPVILPVRLVHKALKTPGYDLKLPSKPVNTTLKGIFSAERPFLKTMNFPFGLSIVCIARKV